MYLTTEDVNSWLKEQLFDAIPMGLCVIDRNYNLIHANIAFEQMFGEWRNRKCHDVYKGKNEICSECKSFQTFEDGIPGISEEVGYYKNGRFCRCIKHTVPILNKQGQISCLLDLCTDATETDQVLREYQLLFDQVPCNILLIDRNYRIVKTNARTRQTVGDIIGDYCYRGLKGADSACSECTARLTFEDGKLHTGHHIWRTIEGKTVHLHVIAVPLLLFDGSFDIVMEMAVDITQTINLESGLNFAHTFLETMVDTSMDGIFAVDKNGNVSIFNSAARRLFEIRENQRVTWEDLEKRLPAGTFNLAATKAKRLYLPDTTVVTMQDKKVPVRLVGNKLLMEGENIGVAYSIQDLTEIKQLQNQKLEAERLAAVGQTVAGLAHGVKNLITALDGGMYMLKTGIGQGNIDRVHKGMEMLDRNIERISMFVNTFLGFAKGRVINAKLSNPCDIASEVVSMYAAKAKECSVILRHEHMDTIRPAPIDYESMHQCLTNLVGNAIDACNLSGQRIGLKVIIRTMEINEAIIYEVIDNGCGMDYEIKKKIFTNFFTTKGLGGTGLGLLMTKKIVQEHGGKIEYESDPGKGTTFRIRLERNHLPKLAD